MYRECKQSASSRDGGVWTGATVAPSIRNRKTKAFRVFVYKLPMYEVWLLHPTKGSYYLPAYLNLEFLFLSLGSDGYINGSR